MKLNLKDIPKNPGIYFFLNNTGKIIYIGKAKNLWKRVNSYWAKTDVLTEQKHQMLKEITKVQYTIVDNETESLLLEAAQIKKHQPKYNIVLKDDKSWAYLALTNEAFPRLVLKHGRSLKSSDKYFGPYISTLSARTLLQLIHRIVPLRTCKRNLEILPKGKVCLKYHLGLCLGPCEKLITSLEYQKLIDRAISIIKGETKTLKTALENEIRLLSGEKKFEEALSKKNQLQALERLQAKQKIIGSPKLNQDLVNIYLLAKQAVVTVMQVRAGILGDKFNFLVQNKLNLNTQEILEQSLKQFYLKNSDIPPRLISLINLDLKNINLNLQKNIVTKIGKNKQLLNLLYKNAEDYAKKFSQAPELKYLVALQKLLNLKNLPHRIEVYDISNIQGNFSYGSMIVFVDEKIASQEYRLFKIKNIDGPNDVASLKQVLARRQEHLEWPEPDLIILDGGKAQLNTVYPILKPAWQNKVISLAKKEEELFLPASMRGEPGQKHSIKLNKKEPLSLFIQHMRNQAHKFGIKNYRLAHRRAFAHFDARRAKSSSS